MRVLRAAGCDVTCNLDQTCCGQPAWNAGFAAEAARVAAHHAGRARGATSAAAPRRSWCRRARAPRWCGCSGPSCSRSSATTTRPTGPRASARAHLRAHRAARRAADLPPLGASPRRPVGAATARATCCASCASCDQPADAPRPGRRLRARGHGSAPTGAAGSAACSASSCPRRRWPWPTRSSAPLAERRRRRRGRLRHVVPAAPAGPGRGDGRADPDPPPRRGAGRRRCPPARTGATVPTGSTGDAAAAHRGGGGRRPRSARNVARAVDRFAAHRADGPRRARRRRRAARRGRAGRSAPHGPGRPARPARALRRPRRSTAAATCAGRPTADDASRYIVGVAPSAGARHASSSRSRWPPRRSTSTAALEAAGAQVVETDLGEWIIQLARRGAQPHHRPGPPPRPPLDRATLFGDAGAAPADLGDRADRARRASPAARLREEFLAADVGITGANFAVAETGSIVLVTNEGNGRMVTVAPAGPRRRAGHGARSSPTGTSSTCCSPCWPGRPPASALSSYTSIVTGPRATRARSTAPTSCTSSSSTTAAATCSAASTTRCSAASAAGRASTSARSTARPAGHAYGWVYPGPMGAVLTPLLAARPPEAAELAGASTLCGACMDACPVQIPLQDLLLSLRRAAGGRRGPHRAGGVAGVGGGLVRRRGATAPPPARPPGAGGPPAWPGTSRRRGPGPRGRTVPRPAGDRFRDRWRAEL